jgi:cytochrome P450
VQAGFAATVAGRGSFDAVADLARPYSLTVVADLVGLPHDDRDAHAALAERAFNVFGPARDRTTDGFMAAGELIRRAFAAAEPGALLAGGRGEALCRQGMPALLFARHPDQWDDVRADRSLIPGAFDDVLRLHSPVQFFTRHVTEDTDLAAIPAP